MDIVKVRQYLHYAPELSGIEINTSDYIEKTIRKFNPSEVIKFGKSSIAFVFAGKEKGKTVMLRCELDALPIQEKTDLDYISKYDGISHLCGHDGHMAIMISVAEYFSNYNLKKGNLIILFQSAEETGEGAKELMNNEKFINLKPDCIFGLHNIPGETKHSIIVNDTSFSMASKGITIKLNGKTSHAAEPENGISPTLNTAEIINFSEDINKNWSKYFLDRVWLTIVHIKLGEIAFGTSPGYAEIRITLRSSTNKQLEQLSNMFEDFLSKSSQKHNLSLEIEYSEQFPATENTSYLVDTIRQAANKNNFNIEERNEPYKWSEDFGYYSKEFKTAFFGLGSGKNHASLHNPNYDFPDEIIETGARIFKDIALASLA
ncbi:MAG: amidohydrolase [Marinifilaceae bacterium]|jgi:amidohydrolase|nr:amidohydrolase [Marinifilaceae bacterium]